MTDTLVQTIAVSKRYPAAEGSVTVLSGVTLQIGTLDRIALIGPSGSGKSTLLHILAGLVDPSDGEVTWPGLGAKNQLMPRKVQTAFQTASLFPALTVLDNIALPLLLAGEAAQPGLTPEALLDRFGLTDLSLKLPEELSGGQAQRIAMLRALSVAPRLILADEPTGPLDSTTSQDFLTGVIAVADAIGAALVIATHDPAIAARMGRQWSIDHGTLWTDTSHLESPQ